MAQPEQRRTGGYETSNVRVPGVTEGDRRALEPRKGRPTWSDIQGWHKEGLGRVIGAADFYALRYSTGNPDWRADRVLLIFPETNDLCLVGPKESISAIAREREAENEGYRSDFTAIFSHSFRPYRHPSWYPAVGSSTYASFLESASAFSVVVHKNIFLEEERDEEIQRALRHERHFKERERVKTLGGRGVLEGALDTSDLVFLAGLGKEFTTEIDTREHDQNLRAAGAREVNPDDIVTLHEDLHHFERGEEI